MSKSNLENLKKNDRRIWLAVGENCMPIDVLRRHNKDAPSTPFSTGRLDIEHVEYFEKTNYKDLINPSYLIEANAFTDKCYLNVKKKSSGIFRPGKHNYVEFTHHNPMDEEDKNKLIRRIQRMKKVRELKRNKVIFYHHRSKWGFKYTKQRIKDKAIKILNLYNGNTQFMAYSQTVVQHESERGVNMISTSKNRVIFCEFKTLNFWGGNDTEIFFGKNDDDLFKLMFDHYEKNNK